MTATVRKLLSEVAADMRPPVNNRDLAAVGKALRDQQATVDRLAALVDEQQAVIALADPEPVEQARRALAHALADAAEGRGAGDAVAKAETALDKARRAMDRQQQAADIARTTLDGLQPRLDAARRERDKLCDTRNALLVSYFRTEQKATGDEYRAAFEQLQAAYSKLAVLSDELEAVGAGWAAHIGQDFHVPDPAGGADWNLLDEATAGKASEAYRRKLADLEV